MYALVYFYLRSMLNVPLDGMKGWAMMVMRDGWKCSSLQGSCESRADMPAHRCYPGSMRCGGQFLSGQGSCFLASFRALRRLITRRQSLRLSNTLHCFHACFLMRK